MIIGGIPTHRATMMPTRELKSREYQPLVDEEAEEDGEGAEDGEDGAEEPSAPLPSAEEEPSSLLLLVFDDVDVGGAAPAIAPTLIVVVEVGVPADSWLQLNIRAAISPLIRP